MAQKRKTSSKTTTSKAAKTDLVQHQFIRATPVATHEFTIHTDCPFIAPKDIKVAYQLPNKISFVDRVELVLPNMSHSGLEGARTFDKKDGGTFDKMPSITLKNVNPSDIAMEGLNNLVLAILDEVEEIAKQAERPVTMLFKPPYYETKDSDNQIELKLFDSPLYICHADTTSTGLFSYMEANKAYSAALNKDPETHAVFFEYQGFKHFYTPTIKTAVEETMKRVSLRDYPEYIDGMIFGDHLINVRVSLKGFYLKPVSEDPEESSYQVRINMYLNQIRVIETDTKANGDNAKFGIRRLTSGSNKSTAELDFLM